MKNEQPYEFDQVYQEHKQKVTRMAKQKMRDNDRVADVVQEVFGVLYENLIARNPIQNISAWLLGVTRNKISEAKRKDSKFLTDMRAYDEGEYDDDAPLFLHEILPDAARSSESNLYNAFIKEQLEKAIETLPEDQRWVFIQHEVEEKSFKEMEEETGIGVKTLLSRKHYAVEALQKKLKQVYKEYKL